MQSIYTYFPKRIFLFGILLFCVITSLLLLSNYISVREEIILETQKHANIIAKHLSYELFDVYGLTMEELSSEASDDFNNHFLKQGEPLGVENVKIYNAEGYIVFSDDPSIIGMRVPENENFKIALTNQITSNIASKEYFRRMYNIEVEKDLIETYIPIYDVEHERIIGVFEVYQDYAPLSTSIKNAVMRNAKIIILLMLCFSIVLFALVRRGNMIISVEKERLVCQLEETVKARTRELRESEQKYKTFLENITDSIVVMDAELNIVLVNNKTQEITGYSYDELMQMNFNDIVSNIGGNVSRADENFIKVLSGASVGFELDIKRKDGSVIPLEITAKKIYYDGQGMIMVAGRDIRERKEMERFKGDFNSMLTHDFRVPLTPIIGFSQVLLDGKYGELNEESAGMVEGISRNASRLNKLIDDFLLSSKIESNSLKLSKKKLELHGIIDEVLRNHETLMLSKGIKLLRNYCRDKLFVDVDSSQLERVISNLISNAIKYNSPGGIIKVITSMQDNLNADNMAKIDIYNSHGVIKDSDLSYIFEKYRRAEDAKNISGTGLGLYIARSIIDLHGGEIMVSSSEGIGTTFTIKLDLSSVNQHVI